MRETKGEYECLISMPDLTKYVGKWIAVLDGKIVSTGNNGKDVLQEAREISGEKIPLILKVPSNSVMLL